MNKEYGKGYTISNLKRFRQFYNYIQKGATLSHRLTWSHYSELLPLEKVCVLNYYIKLIEEQNLTIRELRKRIKNKEYERLDEQTKQKLIKDEKLEVQDTIKNPIIIKSNANYEVILEKLLQKMIFEDIPSFLDELGNGFTFIRNEYKIKNRW